MRIVLMGFFVILIVLSCGLAIRYNQDASYARDELNGERYKRMTAEEELDKAATKIQSLEAELERVQKKLDSIEVVYQKTRMVNEDLRNRLDRAAKIKISLDERIAELQQLVAPF